MPESPLTKGKYFQLGTYTGSFSDAFVLEKDQFVECMETYGGGLPRITDLSFTLHLGILQLQSEDAAAISHSQFGTQASRYSRSGTSLHSGHGTIYHSGYGTSFHSGYGIKAYSGFRTVTNSDSGQVPIPDSGPVSIPDSGNSHFGLRTSFQSGLRISFHSGLSNNWLFRTRDMFPFRFSPRREESTGPSDAFPVGSSQDSFSVYTPESASSIKRMSSAPATFEQALAEHNDITNSGVKTHSFFFRPAAAVDSPSQSPQSRFPPSSHKESIVPSVDFDPAGSPPDSCSVCYTTELHEEIIVPSVDFSPVGSSPNSCSVCYTTELHEKIPIPSVDICPVGSPYTHSSYLLRLVPFGLGYSRGCVKNIRAPALCILPLMRYVLL